MCVNRLPRLLFTLICLAGLASGCTSLAAPVRNRITQTISQAERAEIPNSVNPKVSHSTDLGPAAPETRLESMTLQFSMTAEQQTQLDQLLSDLQNPASPRYHQWLTPAQFSAQFGLSTADLAKVRDWLNSQGFTVTSVANGGQFISFTGTAAQAQTAFGTSIHNVAYNGATHFANVTNTSIPGAIATVVSGVAGLNNFRMKPRVRANAVRPAFTSSVSGNHYLAPGDLYTIYGMNALLGSGINGTGVTIAVTGQVDINLADIAAFRTASGLSTATPPTTIHAGPDPGVARSCSSATSNNCPSPNQDDLAESSIDVEWASAMAPGATILFVNGQDIMLNSLTQAVDQNMAPIVTTSYGACEAGWGTTELNLLGALLKQAATQGQTVLAASADEGATDCDAGPSATQGLTVDFPASSPYVTGLGGTQFNDGTATGESQYWANSEGSTSNAGSALGYIPEVVWNDGTCTLCFGASGGGASGFYTKPAWQVGTGVPSDGSRDLPDISLNASDAHDEFLYCVNVATGSSCTSGFRKADTTLTVAGGTSFDSQIFGGMLALIEQKIGTRIGNANPVLYALANNPAYYVPGATILTNGNVVFNDITSGDNKMPCTAGSPNCPRAGGSIGYSATNGYDLATGWGSVNLTNLANAWTKVTALGTGTNGSNASTTALSVSPGTVAAGATVTLTATVSGSAGTPTGTVQFLVNGTVVGTGTLTKGVATYTYTTSCANLAALTSPRLLPQQPDVTKPSGGAWYEAGSGTVAAACLLFLVLPRRRRMGSLFIALIAVAITASLAGCSGGGTVANPSTSSSTSTTTTANGKLVVTASYSGSTTYTSSIASGLTAGGFTTTTSSVTPITVTVTPGGC